MIKTLQENVVAVPKPLLQQTKGVQSNEITEKHFENVPVYSALEGHQVVRKEDDDSYVLDTVTLTKKCRHQEIEVKGP